MARKRVRNFYKDDTRDYEFSVIVHQSLSQDDLKKKLEEIKEIAKSLGAEIKSVANTQLKAFAYPIAERNNKKGYFACIYLTMQPEHVAELTRKVSIQDHILRFFVVLTNPKKLSQGLFAANYEDDVQRGKKNFITYNDPNTLIKFIGERGKIEPRKQSLSRRIESGIARRQRTISKAIKQARFMSFVPYVEE